MSFWWCWKLCSMFLVFIQFFFFVSCKRAVQWHPSNFQRQFLIVNLLLFSMTSSSSFSSSPSSLPLIDRFNFDGPFSSCSTINALEMKNSREEQMNCSIHAMSFKIGYSLICVFDSVCFCVTMINSGIQLIVHLFCFPF